MNSPNPHLLLTFSKAIARVRDKIDLLRFVAKQIRPHFGFYDCGLFVFNHNKTNLEDWTVSFPQISPSEMNTPLARQQAVVLAVAGSSWEIILSRLRESEGPVLYDYHERLPKWPECVQAAIIDEIGYQESLFARLLTGGQELGVFVINALESGHFQPSHLELLGQLADLIAVAVANILANEEVLQREREKSQLLAISNAIVAVQSRDDLLRVVFEQIHQLLPFDDAGIDILNKVGDHYQKFLTEAALPSEVNSPLAQSGYTNRWLPLDEVLRTMFFSHQPVLLDLENEMERHPQAHWVTAFKSAGIKQVIGRSLAVQGKPIGTLVLNSQQADQYSASNFPLFNGIADQVAVAVANILANEEILESEREKAKLLALMEALSLVRTRQELMDLIHQQVQPLFGFNPMVQILLLSPDRAYLDYFLMPADQQLLDNPLLAPFYPRIRQQGLFSDVFHKGKAFIRPKAYLQAKAREHPLNHALARLVEEFGIEQVMITLLQSQGQVLGSLHVHSSQADLFHEHQLTLFSAVADQIAVAVANILANEEILNREREKALQLAITNALTTEADWASKLLTVVKTIQPHIPFDYVIAGLQTQKQTRYGFSFYRTGADEYQIVSTDDFLRLAGLTTQRLGSLLSQADYSRPLLLNGPELTQYNRQDELKRLICQTFRLQSHLLLPVPLSREGRFVLSFYCRHEATYRPEHLELGQKLMSTLALSIDRLLAYEQVEALSQQLQQENTYLQEEVNTNYRFEEIVGSSQAMRDVFQKVNLVGPMNSTVLILGESGTGKELVARAIHQASPRYAKPLIKINCAALPAQLIESELFGHERGAFTGAVERRIGKFELAHESTIFLDEIGELPLELQAKLLRVLQEKEFERLGSNKLIKADVRVLAATNRNLEKEVAEGRFRADLYFRLNVYPIKLPPLRERKEDIPLLAVHFCQKLSKKLGKPISGLSNGAIRELQAYHWPGNIRELEHVMERAAIESVGGTIKSLALVKRPDNLPPVVINPAFQLKSYTDHERELIMNTLRYCNGRIRGTGGAAQILKVKATTLEARMKKLGIRRDFFFVEQSG